MAEAWDAMWTTVEGNHTLEAKLLAFVPLRVRKAEAKEAVRFSASMGYERGDGEMGMKDVVKAAMPPVVVIRESLLLRLVKEMAEIMGWRWSDEMERDESEEGEVRVVVVEVT